MSVEPQSVNAPPEPVRETVPGRVLAAEACRHDWIKAEPARQSLEAEGKIVWTCRSCQAFTHTYNWRTPS